jgi:hypothetical protein
VVEKIVEEQLGKVGFPIDDLLVSIAQKKIQGPFLVTRSSDKTIGLLQMPNGSYFRGVVCWIRHVPFLIDRELAEEWKLFPSADASK